MNLECTANEIVDLIRQRVENLRCPDHASTCVDCIELAEKERQVLHWDAAVDHCQNASPPCGQTHSDGEYCRAIVQTYIGVVYHSQGKLDMAEERYQQCANDFATMTHPDARWNEAICQYAIGLFWLAQGDLDQAQKALQHSQRSAVGHALLEGRIRGRVERIRILRYQRQREQQWGQPQKRSIPVIGMSAAGEPRLAIEVDQEPFLRRLILAGRTCVVKRALGSDIDPEQLTFDKDHFALYIEGSSMVDAGITNGDYVVFRPQSHAAPNDIVVARIDYPDGARSTVKRFDRQGNTIHLKAENPDFEPQVMIFTEKDPTIAILGKAVAVATVQ